MKTILKQIEAHGYATSVHRMDGYVETHAVQLDGEGMVHIARAEGESDHDVYLAVCALAEMVGIELRDG